MWILLYNVVEEKNMTYCMGFSLLSLFGGAQRNLSFLVLAKFTPCITFLPLPLQVIKWWAQQCTSGKEGHWEGKMKL